MKPEPLLLAVSLVIASVSGCSSDRSLTRRDACWERLRLAYYDLHGLANTDQIDGQEARRIRAQIGDAVRECWKLGRHFGQLFDDPFPADVLDDVTLLDFAAIGNDPELVQDLLESGFTGQSDPGGKAVHAALNGNTLHAAAYFSSDRVIGLLLDSGIAPGAPDPDGVTPLMLTSARSLAGRSVILQLLRAGADVNARRDRGGTALLHAVESGDMRKAEILLEHGADTSITYEGGRDIFEVAKQQGRLEMLPAILTRMPSPPDAGPD